jgi:hypothetical protein
MIPVWPHRDWPRYAKALDMRLAGASLNEIGEAFGVTKQRAHQMINVASRQLAFRIFKGIQRPRFTKNAR